MIRCVCEHNGNDTLLWAVDFIGAFTRGETKEIAISKMNNEIKAYSLWARLDELKAKKNNIFQDTAMAEENAILKNAPSADEIVIVQDAPCNLQISDADSDVLFESEKTPLTIQEYLSLKSLALKSAADFLLLYNSIPDKLLPLAPKRKTFYGSIPRSAEEMYTHTKKVNAYYFGEIGASADNNGNIYECRLRGFSELEGQKDFLSCKVTEGSYGELWSVRKMLRRFIWHDRIHAKAMYRLAVGIWGQEKIPNVFMLL